MADFLPQGQTPAARFMLRELRSGTAARLLLIGVEGAPPAELARISRAMAPMLEKSGLFALVNNGSAGFGSTEEKFLLDHRYLLAPTIDAAAFTPAALRTDVTDLLAALTSSAAPLAAHYGFRDPTGAFVALISSWIGTSHIHQQDGVWFAADRPRALILAESQGNGMDIRAQQQVAATVDSAFRATTPGGARLLVAGPPIFSLHAAQAVRADLKMISILSTVLIALLLLWRFRSLWVLAAIAIPIALSLAAAALAVQLAFGFLHGVTLGFGATMLGITVDYPVLLIGHRRLGEPASGTLGRIGRTLVLTVATASLGLTGMLFSGFPGLSQLGLFAVTGIIAAALATRFLLPPLIVRADLAPTSTGAPAWLLQAERLRWHRHWLLLPICAALLYLLVIGGPHAEQDLSHLSPVPPADLALDGQMRAEIGAPEAGELLVVSGPDEQAILRQEESFAPVLAGLIARHVLDGAEIASRYLPSIRTQQARQAALPPDLPARMQAATAGLPFQPDAFAPFLADVAAARTAPPLTRADITDPLLAARLAPLLFSRSGTWYGIIAPTGIHDPAALVAALPPGILFIDVGAETNTMLAAYTGQAWRWLAIGGAGALVALTIGLHGVRRLPIVLGPIAGAVIVTLAILAAAGVRLSLFHMVAFQLMVGVALDYALFFARRQLDGEERARTFRTLVICNAMTLLTFGLLALCQTPLLRGIGETVATGVLAAIFLAFMVAGDVPDRTPPIAEPTEYPA